MCIYTPTHGSLHNYTCDLHQHIDIFITTHIKCRYIQSLFPDHLSWRCFLFVQHGRASHYLSRALVAASCCVLYKIELLTYLKNQKSYEQSRETEFPFEQVFQSQLYYTPAYTCDTLKTSKVHYDIIREFLYCTLIEYHIRFILPIK